MGDSNQRVLIWNTWPTANFQAANRVLGQPDFTSTAANNGSISAATLGGTVTGIAIRAGKLVVSDASNHRVLVWNSWPTADFQAADLILGQPNATSNTFGTAADAFHTPYQVATDGTRIAVADTGNHRVLIWRTWPTATGQAPDFVVGQNDVTSALRNRIDTAIPSRAGLNGPQGVAVGATHLVVGDRGNYRVLIWNVGP